MSQPKFEHIKKVIDTLELIKWLNIQYHLNSENMDEIYLHLKNEKPELIIFTHWITYINDRIKKVSNKKWQEWVDFFHYLISKYLNINDFSNFNRFKQQLEFLRNSITQNSKIKQIKQILPQDWTNIVYTLWVIGKFYKKNFLNFLNSIFQVLSFFKMDNNESVLLFLEFYLYLLSYSVADKKGNLKKNIR
ncbi:MAG: hypothetical protein ACTSQP_08155 [Promethearchaeota archaeon]